MSHLHSVYGHQPRETVAVFFDYGDAVSFVSDNRHGAEHPTGFETRNLYISTRPDKRERGYRFDGWRIEFGIAPDNLNPRVAA